MKKIIELLNTIAKDKLLHFAIGAVLSALTFVVLVLCGVPTWIAVAVAVVVDTVAALWKDYRYDARPDWWDILTTLLGGAIVWIAILFTMRG